MQAYAGIGSRETPSDIIALMEDLGLALASRDFVLRSGGADGADAAFERGCDEAGGAKEIYLPWSGFNGRRPGTPGYYFGVDQAALALAAQHHPAWERCSRGARALHARNGYQVLGRDLATPVKFVLCWTRGASGQGGTGQAIRIARAHGIPIHDLGDPRVRQVWETRLQQAIASTP